MPMGSRRVGRNWATSLSLSCIGEGNGNPLQCSCLEHPRDGGPWWATVYGVTQSRTQLKRLSSSSSSMVGLMVTCKRTYTKGPLPGLLLPLSLSPQWTTPDPQETLQHYQVGLVQSSMESLFLSTGSWHAQDFICVFQEWNLCFPPSCGSPIIKFCSSSKSDPLGIPSPFDRSPWWETWCGA